MADVTVELISDGVRALLKSSEVQAECLAHANSMQASLGEGYSVYTRNYPERSGAAVVASSSSARKDNSDNNSLLKGLGS